MSHEPLARKKQVALGGIVPNLLRTPKAMPYLDVLRSLLQVRRVMADKQKPSVRYWRHGHSPSGDAVPYRLGRLVRIAQSRCPWHCSASRARGSGCGTPGQLVRLRA